MKPGRATPPLVVCLRTLAGMAEEIHDYRDRHSLLGYVQYSPRTSTPVIVCDCHIQRTPAAGSGVVSRSWGSCGVRGREAARPGLKATGRDPPGRAPFACWRSTYEVRRWTFPAFRHAVQTLSLTGRRWSPSRAGCSDGTSAPSTRRLWALRPSRATWLPKLGSLPHTSQRFDISILLERVAIGCRPPIAMSIEKGEVPLRKRWSTAWETRAGSARSVGESTTVACLMSIALSVFAGPVMSSILSGVKTTLIVATILLAAAGIAVCAVKIYRLRHEDQGRRLTWSLYGNELPAFTNPLLDQPTVPIWPVAPPQITPFSNTYSRPVGGDLTEPASSSRQTRIPRNPSSQERSRPANPQRGRGNGGNQKPRFIRKFVSVDPPLNRADATDAWESLHHRAPDPRKSVRYLSAKTGVHELYGWPSQEDVDQALQTARELNQKLGI